MRFELAISSIRDAAFPLVACSVEDDCAGTVAPSLTLRVTND